MSQRVEPLWYSFSGNPYTGDFPAYYNPDEFAWAIWAEENFSRIKEGVERWMNREGYTLQPYFHEGLVSQKSAWKFEPFYNWGHRNDKACKEIPELDELFQRIEGLTSAAISQLDAGADILPHYGDTNAIVRCHFGLRIPAGLPECGLEVKGEKRAWQEGKWLLFCDAHLHRAWNHSQQTRYVLIVDVILPHYLDKKDAISTDVLSLHGLQKLEQRFPVVKNLPGVIRGVLRRLIKYRVAK